MTQGEKKQERSPLAIND